MRPFSTEWRHAALRLRLGKRLSRSLGGLTLVLAAATTTFGWQPARAAVDDNWAGPMISETRSEPPQEAARAARGRSDSDDDGVRPQRKTPLKQKTAKRNRDSSRTASLARDVTPAPLRPLSVIEWARPKFEAVIESISVKYTMFDGNGMPLRATVHVRFKEARNIKVGKPG